MKHLYCCYVYHPAGSTLRLRCVTPILHPLTLPEIPVGSPVRATLRWKTNVPEGCLLSVCVCGRGMASAPPQRLL